MHVRLLATAVMLLTAAAFSTSCGQEFESTSHSDCYETCPTGLIVVEQCPAFTTCEEYPGCDAPLICVPADSNEDEDQNQTNHQNSCLEPPQCPPGTSKVTSCPDGQLCTRITHCETTLICHELNNACQIEPLCPDGDRAVEDYACDEENDPSCYRHLHCSGPVTCLVCEDLPDSCPDDLMPIPGEDCEDEDLDCQRVETCQETLFCAPPHCEADSQCPDESVQRDDCPLDNPHCFAIEACGQPVICGAPTAPDDCRAVPTCPEYYDAVAIDLCLEQPDLCLIRAECGDLIACLPAP